MPVISFCGVKGGTLKTASALSVSSLMAVRGLSVTLVDLDPQHSATLALPRITESESGPREVAYQGVHDPLRADAVEIEIPEVTSSGGRLELIRGGRGLITARRGDIHHRLDGLCSAVTVVDTIPAIDEIVIGTMERSALIIISVEPTADAICALPGVLGTAETVASSTGGRIRLMLTRADVRERITADVRGILKRDYPEFLYRTEIPVDVRAKEATSYLRPVSLYDPSCRAAHAYRTLVGEIASDLALDLNADTQGGRHGAA